MKKVLLYLLMLMCMPAMAQFEKAPAFPGAEGHGRYTTGGRGGKVYHVTKLTDDGSEGTFRWACNKSGARIIVFDVSGTIYLKSELRLRNGNVSILGQTAPGDGICIADYPFQISSSNVIIRYMRFRLGNRNVKYHEGDGLGGMDQANIIVDHCSVSWSIDECLSVYGSKNITVQWNIVDQSLVDAGHEKGAHGYGGNWGGSGASYHHNLLAHHTSRSPRLGPRPSTQTDERMDLRNNVMYNWGGNGCYGGEGMNVNIVNNYYQPGPSTPSGAKGMRIAAIGIRTTSYTGHGTNPNEWDKMWHVWGDYYVEGNFNSKYSEVSKDNWTYGIYNQINNSDVDNTFTAVTKDTLRASKPIPYGWVTTHKAYTAYGKVLDYAGASFRRDSHDAYIVNDALKGTAKYTGKGCGTGFVNSQDEAGGWPELKSEAAPLDTDGDGMPDEWETKHGLNPKGSKDQNLYNLDSKRYYTNIEVYCNSLVEEQTKAQRADAKTDIDGYFEEYYPDMRNGEANPPGVEDDDTTGGGSGSGDSGTTPDTPPTGEAEEVIYYWEDGMEQANKVSFSDGATVAITGNSGKNVSGGSRVTVDGTEYKSIKVSNGSQNTFVAPSGKTATKVIFYSYINKGEGDTDRTSFWAEVDGVTYTTETTAVHKSYQDGANPDVVTFPIGGKNAFTFTNTGDQLCYVMKVTYGSASGITNITTSAPQTTATYNLQGQRVPDSYRGIVIRNGRKYINR